MTLHINYTHQCAQCQAYYLPYNQVPCPKCGLLEEERFDFIPQAVRSANYNFEMWGSYIPNAWWMGSFADSMLALLFPVLETHRKQTRSVPLSEIVKDFLDTVEWGERHYLRDYVRELATAVGEELEKSWVKSGGRDG